MWIAIRCKFQWISNKNIENRIHENSTNVDVSWDIAPTLFMIFVGVDLKTWRKLHENLWKPFWDKIGPSRPIVSYGASTLVELGVAGHNQRGLPSGSLSWQRGILDLWITHWTCNDFSLPGLITQKVVTGTIWLFNIAMEKPLYKWRFEWENHLYMGNIVHSHVNLPEGNR
jgi:hypothetical protein